jgi:hypothetical protein
MSEAPCGAFRPLGGKQRLFPDVAALIRATIWSVRAFPFSTFPASGEGANRRALDTTRGIW